jgi:hypothetical protein
VAFQFTMQRGYLAVAQHHRAEPANKREATVLYKAFYICEKTRTYGAFSEPRALFQFASRLTALQGDPEVRSMFQPQPPVRLQVGKIEIRLETDHVRIPFPTAPTRRSSGLQSYRETLSEAIRKVFAGSTISFDISGLEQLNLFDLRFYAGMDIAALLVTTLQPFQPEFRSEVAQLLDTGAVLNVYIHRSADALQTAFPGVVHTTASLPQSQAVVCAYYDRRTRTLHVGVPEDESRKYTVSMLNDFAASPTAKWEGHSKQMSFGNDFMYTPLSHECWHFMAQHIPIFKGLPPALEEGFASIPEFLEEAMSESVVANAGVLDRFSPPQVFRDRAREAELASRTLPCSKHMRGYWELLAAAAQTNSLVGVRELMKLDEATLSGQKHVSLLYAEGWAIALQLFVNRGRFDELRSALAQLPGDSQNQPIWNTLDRELLWMPEAICGSTPQR